MLMIRNFVDALSLFHFWATVCRTVRQYAIGPMSVYVYVSCNVGVLWPNGWMDHDAAWYGPRPRPHCV